MALSSWDTSLSLGGELLHWVLFCHGWGQHFIFIQMLTVAVELLYLPVRSCSTLCGLVECFVQHHRTSHSTAGNGWGSEFSGLRVHSVTTSSIRSVLFQTQCQGQQGINLLIWIGPLLIPLTIFEEYLFFKKPRLPSPRDVACPPKYPNSQTTSICLRFSSETHHFLTLYQNLSMQGD